MEDENRVACGSPDAFVQRACETLVHRVLHDDEPRVFADEGPSDFGRTIAAPVFDDKDFPEGRILQPQRSKAALQSTSSIEHGDDGGCGAKGFPLQGHRSRSPTLARIQLDSKAKDLAEEPERVARQFHRGSVRRALDPIDRDFGDAQAAHLSSDEDLGIPEPVAGPHMWQEPQHRLALKSLESTTVVRDGVVAPGPYDPIVDPTGHD